MLVVVDAFGRYLASLVGSWRALAAPHPDATVVEDAGFVAARFPSHDVLCNAVLLDAGALDEVISLYAGIGPYAVWALDDDPALREALEAAAFRPEATTRPMHCRLDAPVREQAFWPVQVQRDVDPAPITALNGVGPELLEGVPGMRTYLTGDGACGLVTIPVADDINVSFVATAPAARRRGLATALVGAALDDARADGFVSASLQATPMAERVYARLGFRPVGRWQEWVPST